jgi:hypothetical protein
LRRTTRPWLIRITNDCLLRSINYINITLVDLNSYKWSNGITGKNPWSSNDFQDEHNGFENTAFQISLITMPCTILTHGDSKLKNHDTINSRWSNNKTNNLLDH